jgi:putative colanic acid biosysnthesis UDP-glucose lipid carrier transferase
MPEKYRLKKNVFNIQSNRLRIVRVSSDLIIIIATFFIIKYLFIKDYSYYKADTIKIYFLILSWLLIGFLNGLYQEQIFKNFISELFLIVKTLFYQLVLCSLISFNFINLSISPIYLIVFFGSLFVVLILKKVLTRKILIELRKKGKYVSNLVIVGNNSITLRLTQMIKARPHFGYNIVGIVSRDFCDQRYGAPYLGPLEKLNSFLDNFTVNEIIITSERLDNSEILGLISMAENKGIKTKIIPSYTTGYQHSYSFGTLGPFPLISLRNDPLNQLEKYIVKRLFDIVFSLMVMLLLLWWVIPLVGLLIKLDSKGPIFFRQERWGKNGHPFMMFKFRSMKPASQDLDANGRFVQAKKEDERITPLGKFLRKSSIDELPQFLNVLFGNMSVVGPRPHASLHSEQSKEKVELYMLRHWAKPGITGWAQVNGYRGEAKEIRLMQKRIEFDIWYVENWSLPLDFKIVLMTIYNIIKGEEAAY